MKRFLRVLVATCWLAGSAAGFAQTFPSKSVRLVVPFAPGGSTDVIARIVEPALARTLGQPVVIENKPGAGGVTGTNDVLRAPADGYTLVISTASTAGSAPAINPKTPYSPADMTAIVNLAATPTLIAVNPAFPAKDFAGFLAELKRKPGRYSYASSGVGGISHLQMEAFKSLTGTFITHIPYRGAGPALTDTMGGQVDIVMDALPSALSFIKAGKLRPMVVTSPKRLPAFPDVPTMLEVGLGDMNRMSTFGIIGPKNMPADVVRKLNAAARAALEDATVRQRIDEAGAVPVGGTPEQYAAHIEAEFNQLKRVVQQQGLKIE